MGDPTPLRKLQGQYPSPDLDDSLWDSDSRLAGRRSRGSVRRSTIDERSLSYISVLSSLHLAFEESGSQGPYRTLHLCVLPNKETGPSLSNPISHSQFPRA